MKGRDIMAEEVAQDERFSWHRWPDTEGYLDRLLGGFLAKNGFAAELSDRMRNETGTRFIDWVDHIKVVDNPVLRDNLDELGYTVEPGREPDGQTLVYEHGGGVFPRFVLREGKAGLEVGLKVESVADFSRAHDLGLKVEGPALGPLRAGRVGGPDNVLGVCERRGYRGFDSSWEEAERLGRTGKAAQEAAEARELWHGRRRHFEEDEEGIAETERLLEEVIGLCGGDVDLACHLVFEGERKYWESRNRAARVQKARQDRLGLGWANHDHHTFRCSRRFFPSVMGMFRRLGFEMRERFHAGEHAGWGAQVLEHRVTGVVIFADLDLASEEADQDFTTVALPELSRPNTVGLWVGLHGESILGAGMHHLEAQFDFDALKIGLREEAGIEMMKPFSNFSFLRQAFTEGEWWEAPRGRVERLFEAGWIDVAQRDRFVAGGAIGSHLENLERREGYKGFNQQAVSAIIAETDPRRQGGGGEI